MQNVDQTIIAQYSGSPALTALIYALNDAIDPSALVTEWYNNVWNLPTAQGHGLDVWGRIVGVNRVIAVTGYGNVTLSDAAFLTLIMAKAMANISDGSIRSFNEILLTLFPGLGNSAIVDNEDMTLTVALPFTPTAVQLAILSLPGLLPRPAGVLINYPGSGGGSLAVSIGSGVTTSGAATSYTFAANTASVTGGSGSYVYTWTLTPGSHGTWSLSGQSTPSVILSVSGVNLQVTATATLTCQVLDSVTGTEVTSSTVTYSFQDTQAVPFSLSIGPGDTVSTGASSYTFPVNTATVTGGVGPFLYNWSVASDANGSWTILNATTATATLQVVSVGNGVTSSATLTCRVTDTGTNITQTVSVPYTFTDTLASVSINGGITSRFGAATSYTFAAAQAIVTGGSGSFSYDWYFVNALPGGTWAIGPSGAFCSVGVTAVDPGATTSINVYCKVTDLVTGQVVTSEPIDYIYTQTA